MLTSAGDSGESRQPFVRVVLNAAKRVFARWYGANNSSRVQVVWATAWRAWLKSFVAGCGQFWRRHWKGTLVIALATLVFFWPIVVRINSYSPGGDAMFNAWTLARDQHCILQQHCPNYADGNIFFPHANSMLYSETQLSAGLVTLPLHLLSNNPLLSYNVLTIVSFFLLGWGMYLLAKYLSKGNELVAITAGLIFEFAPYRMAALQHLQNLSIFCLPLAVLLILKYLDTARRKYLWYLFFVLVYVFFASWVQMVFVLAAIGIVLLGAGLLKVSKWRSVGVLAAVVAGAALLTAPLALQYAKFSSGNAASFSVVEQTLYSSSLADYFIPHNGTLLGRLYYELFPQARVNAYNLDSFSYHGLVLYATAAFVVVTTIYLWRKRSKLVTRSDKAVVTVLVVVALVGFLISIGPFLKLMGSYAYARLGNGTPVVIPTPYAVVDKLLPQLHFIRAVGRASVLFLFALCCFLALLPAYLRKFKWTSRYYWPIIAAVCVMAFVELAPVHRVYMSKSSHAYNLQIPAVYAYINDHPEVDDIAILQGSDDYADADNIFAWVENVLWSGYYNRNIFNGYSGYTPPDYWPDYVKMVDFDPATTPAFMKSIGIKYVVINKDLSGPNSKRPQLLHNVSATFPAVYSDTHYALFKVEAQ